MFQSALNYKQLSTALRVQCTLSSVLQRQHPLKLSSCHHCLLYTILVCSLSLGHTIAGHQKSHYQRLISQIFILLLELENRNQNGHFRAPFFTVKSFWRFCFVVKTSADNVILQILHIFMGVDKTVEPAGSGWIRVDPPQQKILTLGWIWLDPLV